MHHDQGRDDETFREVVATYPFPVAYSCRRWVLGITHPEGRVRGIIQTFTAGIQYAALICASEYAATDRRDGPLSSQLERLKRPLISDFFAFVTTAVERLTALGVVPLVGELAAFADAMEKTRVDVPVIVDGKEKIKKNQLLRKALVELRNTLGHKEHHPDWAWLESQYLAHLAAFLRTLCWSARYPLLRVTQGDRWEWLMGASLPFRVEQIPDDVLAELARVEGCDPPAGLLLSNGASPPGFRRLYPMLLMDGCESCLKEPLDGLFEEVFQFNGDEGEYLSYLGPRHGRNTQRPRTAVDAMFDRKKVAPQILKIGQIGVQRLWERAADQRRVVLELNRDSSRYLPGLTRPRPEADRALREFLASPSVGFCLLGDDGAGKTSLICRTAERWGGPPRNDAPDEPSGDVVLLYEGRNLLAGGDLEKRVLHDLYLDGAFGDLLTYLCNKRTRLVLLIDAVNEDESPSRLLAALSEFAILYTPKPDAGARFSLKVVLTSRVAAFEAAMRSTVKSSDAYEAQLFPHPAFFRPAGAGGDQPHRFVLGPLSPDEVGALYEAYRAFEVPQGGQVADGEEEGADVGAVDRTPYRPNTPYAGLDAATRRLMARPSYLRYVLEAYSGRDVPRGVAGQALLREFCRAKIYGPGNESRWPYDARAAFAEALVRHMRQRCSTAVSRGEKDLPESLSRAILERQSPLSPYLQLVDEGVLMEVAERRLVGGRPGTVYAVRFAFDDLLVYLLSIDVLDGLGPAGPTGAGLAAVLVEGDGYRPLTAAVELILTDAAREGRESLAVETLHASGKVGIAPLARLLTALAAFPGSGFRNLLAALASEGQPEEVLGVLLAAARGLSAAADFAPMLTCAETAEAVAGKAGASQLDDAALAVSQQAIALDGLGRTAEALERHELARSVRAQDAGGALGGEVHLKLLINRASILSRIGRYAEALEGCEEAIAAASDLATTGEDRWQVLLASALITRGEALSRLGHPAEAVACFDRVVAMLDLHPLQGGWGAGPGLKAKARLLRGHAARDAARGEQALADYDAAAALLEPVAEEGHDGAAYDLALAWMGKAVSLDATGDHKAALPFHDRAVAGLKCLHESGKFGDLAGDRAKALINRAASVQSSGSPDRACLDYDQAISTLEEVLVEGAADFRADWYRALLGKATALAARGDPLALELLDELIRAIEAVPTPPENRRLAEFAHALRRRLAGG